MQQLASSVCCRRLSWKLRRSRVEVVASMRKRSRDSNGIWLATWRRAQGLGGMNRVLVIQAVARGGGSQHAEALTRLKRHLVGHLVPRAA